MNKSLIERIERDTRRIVAEREAEAKKENRLKVLAILTKVVEEKARKGEHVFRPDESELDVDLVQIFKPMSWEEAQAALIEIGFEIREYPMRNLLVVPHDASEEIKNLINNYNQILEKFEATEKNAAEADCKAVLKKLEDGEYTVKGIGRVTVSFKSEASSESYKRFVGEMMGAEGFGVTIGVNEWECRVAIS